MESKGKQTERQGQDDSESSGPVASHLFKHEKYTYTVQTPCLSLKAAGIKCLISFDV